MRSASRLALSLLLAGVFACRGRPETTASRPPLADSIERVADSIATEMLAGPIAGIAIGASLGGEVVFHKAYGQANLEEGRPLTLDDPHQIGSLTKQFTAAAVLQLVEEGRIALSDTLQQYLPDFDTQGHTVTIHRLLNHTSGIRSYTAVYGMNPVPEEVMLDSIGKIPFDFEPGERFLYNNSGYYLLGLVLEAATGMPYEQYMEEHLFEPLGLSSTSYCGYEGEAIPVGYAPDGGALEPSVLSDMAFPGGAGGLCSTVDDLLAWENALVSGEVVGPDSWRRMTTPDTLNSGERMNYGYGLIPGELEGHETISHGGGIPGYNTTLSYYPADSLIIAVLVNTSPGQPARAEQAVARAALGLPRPVIADLPLSPEERAQFVGTYDLGPLQVRVFEENDVLMAQGTNQASARMKYQGDLTFLLDVDQAIRMVFEVEDGRTTQFTLFQAGQEMVAPRIEDPAGEG